MFSEITINIDPHDAEGAIDNVAESLRSSDEIDYE